MPAAPMNLLWLPIAVIIDLVGWAAARNMSNGSAGSRSRWYY